VNLIGYSIVKMHQLPFATLLKTLALSLTNILPSLTKLPLSPKPATITFVCFAVSSLTSIPQLPVPLLLLSFTPNLTPVILLTINSLSLNYPVSSRSRTLLLVRSLKLLSPAISLPSCALSTGSESMNASNTSSSVLPTKFSQLPNLHTFVTSSLFNVLVVLAFHPSLLLLGHLHRLLLNWAVLGMLHLVSGISSLYLFVNLILVPVLPLPNLCYFTYHFFLFCFTTLLIHNSLSFTPGLKPTCFTSTPVVPLLPPGLLLWTFAGTVSSERIGFCF